MVKVFNYLMIAFIAALVIGLLVHAMLSPPSCEPTPTGCVPILKS